MVRRKPGKAAKKKREREREEEREQVVVTFHIEVDGQNATVTATPNLRKLKLANDNFFKFTSNDDRTFIRFEGRSPIDEAPSGELIKVGRRGIGPFKRVHNSRRRHHFLCGQKNSLAPEGFSTWGGTNGGFPPPDDGGGH